ncbi:MAG: two-component regulator propeller domain-containing protein [Bacteroidota bacterium]
MDIARPASSRSWTTCTILVLLCLSSFAGFAQRKSIKQYVHQVWTTDNGLPQNSAFSFTQTRDGYIWFGSDEGLVRFDGVEFRVFDRTNTKELPSSYFVRTREDSAGGLWARPAGFTLGVVRYNHGSFTHYDTSDGLPSNSVVTWENDKQGRMWLGTPGGLAEFNGGKINTYTVKDGLPSDTVTGLGVDRSNNLWISTKHGLARLADGRIEVMTGQKGFPDSTFLNVNFPNNCYEDSHGTLWMTTPTDLLSYAGGVVTRYKKKDVLTNTIIQAMHEDANGTLWIATAGGLNSFAGGHFTKYNISGDQDENNIHLIREDREGSLWLATRKGIARFAGGSFERYDRKDGLSDNTVTDILIDREGSIWVGTDGGGLNRFRDEKFITYSSKVGLSYDMVLSVFQDHDGAIWIGTTYGGLNRLKDGVITVFDNKQGPPFLNIRAIGEDKEGTLWFACDRGCYTIRNGTIRLVSRMIDGQPDILPGAFLLTRSGDWLLSSRNSLLERRGEKFTTLATIGTESVLRNYILELFEDTHGTIWVSTQDGLYWYRKGKLERVGVDQGFTARWAAGFYEDPEGVIWFGAANAGLFRFKDGKFFNISPRQGLFDYVAYTVFEDKAGYLWMSSNKGVYRASKKELNDVADGKVQSVHCNSYGTADGMESRECNGGNSPSGFQLQDGRICFATTRGLTVINPADIRVNPVAPPVVIDQFLVDGVQEPTSGTVEVPAGKGRFEFHYAGISFAGSNEVRYKYQLVGLDEGWMDAGSRRDAYYTHLDPGKYTFHVIAANSDGVWNEQGASVSFVLKPHFYQTAWFIGLVIFAFLTAGPSFYFYRMRSMKKRRAELEKLVQDRTGELQKTVTNLKETQNQLILSEKMASLGQLTAGIAHEIKNPLNFITNFAVLSHDLTKDLREELAHERDRVDKKRALEIEGILNDLDQNVTKINEHGKRADSIVRGMLLHSRGKAGERQSTDLNALLSEYTNLAYHGMRAQDSSFNVKIETDFDQAIGRVEVVPQDLSRAFLNIVNNACYAANEKRRTVANGFNPIVRVSSRNLADRIEIRIRDNGNGIPQAIREKIFNPFFTTKPAGSGTGLGLSLSYDIVTQEHKGEIRIDTKEGEYTEFLIVIPRDQVREGVAVA